MGPTRRRCGAHVTFKPADRRGSTASIVHCRSVRTPVPLWCFLLAFRCDAGAQHRQAVAAQEGIFARAAPGGRRNCKCACILHSYWPSGGQQAGVVQSATITCTLAGRVTLRALHTRPFRCQPVSIWQPFPTIFCALCYSAAMHRTCAALGSCASSGGACWRRMGRCGRISACVGGRHGACSARAPEPCIVSRTRLQVLPL